MKYYINATNALTNEEVQCEVTNLFDEYGDAVDDLNDAYTFVAHLPNDLWTSGLVSECNIHRVQ
jgi:hypothetical protein